MSIRQFIFPKEKTKNLRFYDVIIISLILFGEFIIRSNQLFLDSLNAVKSAMFYAFPLSPILLSQNTESITETVAETVDTATEGVAYSSNLQFQFFMLLLVFLYLIVRNFDFKQIPFRFKLSVIPWYFVLLAIMGLSADVLYLLFDNGYNYFTKEVLLSMDFFELFRKIAALSPIAIIYLLFRLTGHRRPKVQMANPALLHNYSYILPYLSGHGFRPYYRCSIRTFVLLLLYL